ncbi:MAG: DegT/DnrJ/EryC1/StrS family aminotransferase [Bacteroidetes bacterium]|nr:DegT/DnrJ/EryC1/StrS family aminotransferase [Bacteroidota bacterium]
MKNIFVTRPFLPEKSEFLKYIDSIWDSCILTNNGPLASQLEIELKKYLNVTSALFVTNGTIALQIAIKALELKGKILTTPFSYVATLNSIIWESCEPIFVDIDKNSFNINVDLLESSMDPDVVAIMATHVFGNPCDVEKLEKFGVKHGLKIIYDAAHSFGVEINNESVFKYGDISTTSFHATKLFHTFEGGALFCTDIEIERKLFLLRSFGHYGDDYYYPSINGKNSEIHAAMGLSIIPRLTEIINTRKTLTEAYDTLINFKNIQKQRISEKVKYNYSYYPILLESEDKCMGLIKALTDNNIYPRRYFFPSLNLMPYLTSHKQCVISESISKRILCLPLHNDLVINDIKRISEIINKVV